MSEPIHVLALGAGVQSSTILLKALRSEIEPMPVAAIFADTQDEPAAVYKWLDFLEKQSDGKIPIIRVSRGRLSEKAVQIKVSKKTGMNYTKPSIPVFTKYPDTRRPGRMFRHCSMDMKIDPFRREAKRIAGKGRNIVSWIGISTDEPERIKDSTDPRIRNRWPLIEQSYSRRRCLQWMKENGFPMPPRSACIYCPFHSDEEWLRIKSESEAEFRFAVDFEKRLQSALGQCSRLDSIPYLHDSRVPLDKVDFNTERQQLEFGEQLPCQGICGV